MTIDEMLPFLDSWKTSHQEIDSALAKLGDAVGIDPQSPLVSAMFKAFDRHTKTLAELIGDQWHWLQWYEIDCDMGTKPMSASPATGVPLQLVESTHDLAVLIFESCAA